MNKNVDYLKLFFEKYAFRIFIVGIGIGALVAHSHHG